MSPSSVNRDAALDPHRIDPRREAAGRPRARRRAALAAMLLSALAGPSAAGVRAAEPPGSGPPVWVPVPTRVERGADGRERLAAPEARPDDRIFLRIAPAGPHLGATVFVAEGRVWQLAGIRGVERSRICTAAGGARWACGLSAATALGRAISGRTVVCRERLGGEAVTVVPPGGREAVSAAPVDCELDGGSLAERLVREGWAEPAPGAGPALLAAHAAARGGRRGIHADRAPLQ